jgi:NAD(P)-dependent dehydrogenase (short-subunit alcohol dehydrogenase family)
MDLGLSRRRAVVTGGASGIGLRVATRLSQEGADVALVSRRADAVSDAATALAASTGQRTLGLAADTTDDAAVRRMVTTVVEAWGGVDILVNAAARPAGGPTVAWDELPDADMLDQLDTKVLGYLRCARAVAPHMKAAGWGRIVNVSGLAARQSGSAIGSVRNVAVAALTKNLADDLGPHGINVTVVHPGLTETERLPSLVASLAASSGLSAAEVRTELDRGNSLGRLVTADEVADVITFLASPRSVAVNGDAVAVGGGVGSAIYY